MSFIHEGSSGCRRIRGAGEDSTTGSSENLVYSLGSGEPALNRQYTAGPCGGAPSGLLIDDVPDPKDNTQGCADSRTNDGKFTLQLGDNFTYQRSDGSWRVTGDIAPIDLHQLGAGYDGHAWFTHAYPGSVFTVIHALRGEPDQAVGQKAKSVVLSTRLEPTRPSSAGSGLRSRRRSAARAASRTARV